MQRWKDGPDETCLTSNLTDDIYSCRVKAIGCRFGMPFGNDIFCQHPDRKVFSMRLAEKQEPITSGTGLEPSTTGRSDN